MSVPPVGYFPRSYEDLQAELNGTLEGTPSVFVPDNTTEIMSESGTIVFESNYGNAVLSGDNVRLFNAHMATITGSADRVELNMANVSSYVDATLALGAQVHGHINGTYLGTASQDSLAAQIARLMQITGSGQGAFDEEAYLQHNPDVAQAVANGEIYSGQTHYYLYGKEEGRAVNADVQNVNYWLNAAQQGQGAEFDEAYYLQNNIDVAIAIASGQFAGSAYDHYINHGIHEGRLPNEPVLETIAKQLQSIVSQGTVQEQILDQYSRIRTPDNPPTQEEIDWWTNQYNEWAATLGETTARAKLAIGFSENEDVKDILKRNTDSMVSRAEYDETHSNLTAVGEHNYIVTSHGASMVYIDSLTGWTDTTVLGGNGYDQISGTSAGQYYLNGGGDVDHYFIDNAGAFATINDQTGWSGVNIKAGSGDLTVRHGSQIHLNEDGTFNVTVDYAGWSPVSMHMPPVFPTINLTTNINNLDGSNFNLSLNNIMDDDGKVTVSVFRNEDGSGFVDFQFNEANPADNALPNVNEVSLSFAKNVDDFVKELGINLQDDYMQVVLDVETLGYGNGQLPPVPTPVPAPDQPVPAADDMQLVGMTYGWGEPTFG